MTRLVAVLIVLPATGIGQWQPTFARTGGTAGAKYGGSVVGLGDLDADALADFAVGAPGESASSGPADATGRVRVYSSATGAILFTVVGASPGDRLGASVADAGDLDGDGVPDVIVGAPQNGGGSPTGPGYVRLISGATGQNLRPPLSSSTTGDRYGFSVSGGADMDGDGRPDVVIGIPGANASGAGSGRVVVISGLTGGVLFSINGAAAGDQFGYSVAIIGDLDGDGRADFAAGAPFSDVGGIDAGKVRVFSGATGLELFSAVGGAAGDQFGFCVAAAGDTNGDDIPDLAVGAPHAAAGGAADAGSVKVFRGPLGATFATMPGTVGGDEFGSSIASGGDVDHDGRSDLVIGAPFADASPAAIDAGKVTIISGSTNLDICHSFGERAGFQWGASVAGLQGSSPTVIVGADSADTNGVASGYAKTMAITGPTETLSSVPGALQWRHVPLLDPRYRLGMAQDPVRGRTVMFGGFDGGLERCDTWEWNGAAWQRMSPATSPPRRRGHAMCWDGGRVLLFGGARPGSPQELNDTWGWNGSNWTQLAPLHAPPRRANHNMVYDSVRGRVVLFGGSIAISGGETLLDDTWEWTGSDWMQVTPTTHPSARRDTAMAFDPVHQRTVLYGSQVATDTWLFDGSNWTQVLGASPPHHFGASMAFHAGSGAGGAVVLFGVATPVNTPSQTWLWNGSSWSALNTPTPMTARSYLQIAADGTGANLVMFGGRIDSPSGYTPPSRTALAETWLWNGTNWSQPVSLPQPNPRREAPLAWDSTTGQSLLVGGQAIGPSYADTWTWSGTSWTKRPVSLPAGFGGRFGHALAEVPTGGVISIGGQNYPVGALATDVLYWDGTGWTVQSAAPALQPNGRFGGGAAAYPAGSDPHAVLYGGQSGSSSLNYQDTWAWTGTIWEVRSGGGPIGPRRNHAMAFDPSSGQTLMFGGADNSGNVLGDTWGWNGQSWAQFNPQHSPPARELHRMAMGPNGRLVMFGGKAGVVYYNDLWEWNGSDWTNPPVLSDVPPCDPNAAPTDYLPFPRMSPAFGFDPVRNATVLFGGFHEDGTLFGDTWELQRVGVGQPNSAAARLTLNGHETGDDRGPFLLRLNAGSVFTMIWHGPPTSPLILGTGMLTPGGLTLPCPGTIDIGTPPFFSDLTIVFNGLAGGFPNLFFRLDPTGVSQQAFFVPVNTPPGLVGSLQGAVVQPPGSGCSVIMTAAYSVIIN